ncbi:MAG: NFACT family protein [Clostridia bacterium]|nr:NFACT family protein [Clostridia bacterium]
MAYDAGMLRAALHEINRETGEGAKLEKIYQPARDEVTLTLRMGKAIRRLVVNAGTSSPRVCLSDLSRENPTVAPMFCMLLRKHLAGARLIRSEQIGFERAARFVFAGYDEMGYATEKTLVAEVMGKYSNLMLLDGEGKITAVLRPVDFTTSRLRQVLPGMKYELPPPQDKASPLDETKEGFFARYAEYPPESAVDKFIVSTYLGTSRQVAQEIAYRAGGADATLSNTTAEAVWAVFSRWFADLDAGRVTPTLVSSPDGAPVDFAYAPETYRGAGYTNTAYPDFAGLFDAFFAERDRVERTRQRAQDLFRLLSAARARLTRKLDAQTEELADTAKGEEYRRTGDLIIANLYRLRRGDRVVSLIDYTADPPSEVTVELDPRLSPADNAERFYKHYRKAKTAKAVLSEQIARCRAEIEYLESVESFLDRAETEQDLSDIRDELYRAGYASRMKNYAPPKTSKPSKPTEAVTPGGYRVLVGRNNLQNDRLTFRVAARNDLWFHAKGVPGSHVILLCDGAEPSAEDYTFAASLAAGYSKASAAGGATVPVDYTRVSNVKKPAGAKPGFVIYKTNYTAFVQPERIGEWQKG